MCEAVRYDLSELAWLAVAVGGLSVLGVAVAAALAALV
jgi:hypothetical protein